VEMPLLQGRSKMSEDLKEAGWYLLVATFVMLWMLMMMIFD